jgi:hypothetical protein
MSDPLQEQTVGEFILENEGNLSVATEVARAYPAIQRQIVQHALDALEKRLRSELGKEWEIWNNRDEVLVNRYSGFSVRRPAWGDIYVLFEYRVREENTFVGIWRDRQRPKMASLDVPITEAFKKMPGNANRWWAWYQELPPEYGNWNAAPALSAMQFRQGDTVNYWAEQILLVHKIASPVIDKLVPAK